MLTSTNTGDLMTLDEFIGECKNGNLIDYDGFGYYSDGVKESKDPVYPSEVLTGEIQYKWAYVNWYNR